MSDEDKDISPDTQGIDLSSGDWILNKNTGEIMEIGEILEDNTNFMEIPSFSSEELLELSNKRADKQEAAPGTGFAPNQVFGEISPKGKGR